MSRHQLRRQFQGAVLVLALALSLGLSACGKENQPSAPEGEESRYIYPQFYPKPSSVILQGEEVVVEVEDEVEVEAEAEAEAVGAPKTGEAPTHVGGIGIFPTNLRSKTIYDSGPIE